MNGLLTTFQQALQLLLAGDQELWTIVFLSFSVSLKAIIITTPLALLLAFALTHGKFAGIRIILTFINSLQAVPTVVIGLFLYVLLSRQGPFGDLRLLFTQTAMVVGQMLLCFPILVALGYAAIKTVDRRVWETARTLGAPVWFSMLTVLYEVRFGLVAAVLTSFGRVISEVGISMMVGGNIMGYTRNITTAIALETSKGEFAQGIALGLVLLTLAFLLSVLLSYLQGSKEFSR
ncbi:MAG: ABC transporter permease [SAR324 cluster bacterium]|nr:ABC transporter permease [SAR324 cluster bacterium]MBL7034835.1 ABC transporter permease [SAR324 cluster bacterium]